MHPVLSKSNHAVSRGFTLQPSKYMRTQAPSDLGTFFTGIVADKSQRQAKQSSVHPPLHVQLLRPSHQSLRALSFPFYAQTPLPQFLEGSSTLPCHGRTGSLRLLEDVCVLPRYSFFDPLIPNPVTTISQPLSTTPDKYILESDHLATPITCRIPDTHTIAASRFCLYHVSSSLLLALSVICNSHTM